MFRQGGTAVQGQFALALGAQRAAHRVSRRNRWHRAWRAWGGGRGPRAPPLRRGTDGQSNEPSVHHDSTRRRRGQAERTRLAATGRTNRRYCWHGIVLLRRTAWGGRWWSPGARTHTQNQRRTALCAALPSVPKLRLTDGCPSRRCRVSPAFATPSTRPPTGGRPGRRRRLPAARKSCQDSAGPQYFQRGPLYMWMPGHNGHAEAT